MTTALHTVKKLQLWALIKSVGLAMHEDEHYLQEYGKEVYNTFDVDQAIKCFQEISNQIKDGSLKHENSVHQM